ncbi:VTT domain-containing protein [Magnetospirillum aberrantis]|uniref:TVP38/TMEM64 family membrane protein n=1 Tax=Magnetospirillum aberrantis SpK TaxID=908842 RepID=A0A7C9UWY0_9PROT|nr:TVP38/TMEM64 family protein [Magnetospirillum aberrantis SpK]
MSASRRHPLLDPRVLLRGLVLIATMVAIGWLFEVVGIKSMLNTGWVDQAVRGQQGLYGEALYLAVGAAVVALGLPRQAVAFGAAYAFGPWMGLGLALAATLLGSLFTFYYARFIGRDVLARRFPNKIARIDSFLTGNEFTMAIILRLSPVSHNGTANVAAGVSAVRVLPFFAGSLVGYVPQTVVFVLAGAGFELDKMVTWTLSGVLFVGSTVLGIWLWRRTRAAKGLPDDEEEGES